MPAYKNQVQNTTIESAIADFYSEIEELAGEFRDMVDNASDGLRATAVMQTREETASTLEGLSDPGAPGDFPEDMTQAITVSIQVPTSAKRGMSRAVRCSNAVSGADAAVIAIREWADAAEEALEKAAAAAIEKEGGEQRESLIQEWRDYADEIEDHKDEADGCEFPGMFG